jgi:hypothetical protein
LNARFTLRLIQSRLPGAGASFRIGAGAVPAQTLLVLKHGEEKHGHGEQR